MKALLAKLAEAKKAATALAGIVALLLSVGLLHGQVQLVAESCLSLLTVLGVYRAGNADPKKK